MRVLKGSEDRVGWMRCGLRYGAQGVETERGLGEEGRGGVVNAGFF